MSQSSEIKKRIIEAGRIAIDELIKVAKEPIIVSGSLDENGLPVYDDKLGAEKMKVAAQAKRIAIEDAFAINERITDEENMLDDSSDNEKIKDSTSFAERNAKK